jgi:hypothetical protein
MDGQMWIWLQIQPHFHPDLQSALCYYILPQKTPMPTFNENKDVS